MRRGCASLWVSLAVGLPLATTLSVPLHGQAVASSRFVVLLDAAHGGDDGGAHLNPTGEGGSTAEKTVTLALSVRLRSLLTARGFQVVTTRESNSTVSADARAQVANHASAAACLSLHATEAGSGVHLFVSSLAPSPSGRFLAWKTAQGAYVAKSLKLASVVNSALQHSAGSGAGSGAGNDSGSGTGSEPDADAIAIPVTVARTSLPGVDSMACPALAIEVAPLHEGKGNTPITSEATDARYQTQVVEALAAALLEWRTDSQADAGGGRQP